MKKLGLFFAVLVLSVPSTLFLGYVIQKYWLWFAVTHFGVKPLTLVQCIAATLVWRMFTLSSEVSVLSASLKDEVKAEHHEYQPITTCLVYLVIGYPLMLLLGYLWHLGLS